MGILVIEKEIKPQTALKEDILKYWENLGICQIIQGWWNSPLGA